MHKTHGRLTPAPREEHSNVKGKLMTCPDCGKQLVVSKVVFAETECECGGFMVEAGNSQAKLTGKH
jgi:hypothetical protein